MDEAGIDIQVLSHGAPSTQKLPARYRRRRDARRSTTAWPRSAPPIRNALPPSRRCRRPIRRRPPTSSSARDRARLQGRHDPRHDQRRIPRPQEISGRSTSAPRSSTCRSISIRRCRNPTVTEVYYQDYAKDFPLVVRAGLGLHGGDRDAGDPAGAVRRVREAPEAEDHPRPSRRDAAVSGLAHRRRRSSGRGRSRSASATSSARTSTSPPAASSPIRRCCAA